VNKEKSVDVSNLPAVKRFPFAAPKVDRTTPMGIKKEAGPRTLLPQSCMGGMHASFHSACIKQQLITFFFCFGGGIDSRQH